MQLAYEYAYGYDGRRRWRKDYLQGVWTRYPCGVACCAGDLVEQVSDLSGAMWQTSALSLRGLGLVRRNSEFHHFDILGAAGVITDGNAVVLSDNLYDAFGVQRYAQGSAQTPWRWEDESLAEEGLLGASGPDGLPGRCLALSLPESSFQQKPTPSDPNKGKRGKCLDDCRRKWHKDVQKCDKQFEDCVKKYPRERAHCNALWLICVGNANNALSLCISGCYQKYPPPGPKPPAIGSLTAATLT